MTEDTGRVPESSVGYVLIGGLILSMVVEIVGISAYYAQSGGFSYQFTSQWQMTGSDFFSYFFSLLGSVGSVPNPIGIMALGVVLLMLTSYVRVFATLIHFGFVKNLKYAMISLFIFVVLTISLFVH